MTLRTELNVNSAMPKNPIPDIYMPVCLQAVLSQCYKLILDL